MIFFSLVSWQKSVYEKSINKIFHYISDLSFVLCVLVVLNVNRFKISHKEIVACYNVNQH